MSDSTHSYLYLGLFIFFVTSLQYLFEVAINFTWLSSFTGAEIVLKKENPKKFKGALIKQMIAGCIIILFEVLEIILK